jgi:hypothetical protein
MGDRNSPQKVTFLVKDASWRENCSNLEAMLQRPTRVIRREIMREFEGSIGRTGWSLGSLLLAGVASSALTIPAEALTIVPTYTLGQLLGPDRISKCCQ